MDMYKKKRARLHGKVKTRFSARSQKTNETKNELKTVLFQQMV